MPFRINRPLVALKVVPKCGARGLGDGLAAMWGGFHLSGGNGERASKVEPPIRPGTADEDSRGVAIL
jgi:hypothetical protein